MRWRSGFLFVQERHGRPCQKKSEPSRAACNLASSGLLKGQGPGLVNYRVVAGSSSTASTRVNIFRE